MVHNSDDGNITVVSILYRYGKPDPFLFQVNCRDKIEGLYSTENGYRGRAPWSPFLNFLKIDIFKFQKILN
jgi:hypothetical protein